MCSCGGRKYTLLLIKAYKDRDGDMAIPAICRGCGRTDVTVYFTVEYYAELIADNVMGNEVTVTVKGGAN